MKYTNDIVGLIVPGAKAITATGSREICPQVCKFSTDYDFIVWVDDLIAESAKLKLSFTCDSASLGTDRDPSRPLRFVSLKKGTLNLILTQDEEFYNAFCLATRVAAELGLTAKAHRILLFQAILYRNG